MGRKASGLNPGYRKDSGVAENKLVILVFWEMRMKQQSDKPISQKARMVFIRPRVKI
ncbi:hypothetical protein THF1C08_30359 [Vibrio jasicida]|uniref:Uncharacterized protein n=1 Tax=Vibrio jasicida TaxID=766224 RepID=A0AAU9QS86_9VIBR|nr:hypothetical protein THF1C08_30359 [Vibrio jasicida]CAH1599256.1 hypothetical protein THF1A12_40075 [Vibrio jasicida]